MADEWAYLLFAIITIAHVIELYVERPPWSMQRVSDNQQAISSHDREGQKMSYDHPHGDLYVSSRYHGLGTSNHIPQYLWDVITWPCSWFLLLTYRSIYERSMCRIRLFVSTVNRTYELSGITHVTPFCKYGNHLTGPSTFGPWVRTYSKLFSCKSVLTVCSYRAQSNEICTYGRVSSESS